MNRLLTRLISPRGLLTLAALQALFPYVLWALNGPNPQYVQVPLTGLPLVIWLVAYAAFWAGAAVASLRRPRPAVLHLTVGRVPLQLLMVAGVALALLQTYGLSEVYGGLPLLSYILADGRIDVGVANALQSESGYGQLGLLQATLFTLHALLLIGCCIAYATRRNAPAIATLTFAIVAVLHMLNGKRQGVVMLLVFIGVGSAIVTGSLLDFLASLLRFGRGKLATPLVALFTAAGLLLFAGYIATARTQGRQRTNSLDQYISYLQYPLLNMELQCSRAGYGPQHFELFGPLIGLIPYKSRPIDWQLPPKAEVSSPSSMFEYLHWFWGLPGIVLFMFALGLFTEWAYRRAHEHLFWLLLYCQLAHGLFVAHTSNIFLIMTYIPLPACISAVLAFFCTRNVRDRAPVDIESDALAAG